MYVDFRLIKNHVNINALLLESMHYSNIIFDVCYVRGGAV